jgi:predicted amidohydrolase YtcJ
MRVDAIFTNARIRTLDPERPTAHTIGTLNGRIVGFDDDLHGVDADRVVDLGGQPVLPGFHDAHHHLSLTGFRLASLNLRPGVVNSLAELYEAVRVHAEGLAPDAWVRGSGYDQNFRSSPWCGP